MDAHSTAEKLVKEHAQADLNEADTRHRIVDSLLHDILGWPKSAVSCEEKVHAGYMDYILRDTTGRNILVIETKRSGIYFEVPRSSFAGKPEIKKVRLKTLATNQPIRAALTQVMSYCPQVGSEYACITNGKVFVIFRSFIRGRDFMDSDALVISSLAYFSECFTEAYNLLAYQAVTKSGSLHRALDARRNQSREFFYPKNGIAHYDASFARNPYARFLEPIARRYFGDISQTDNRMMRQCYVFAPGTHEAEAGLRDLLSDRLTPFFHGDGGVEITETRSGGSFTNRIAGSLAKEKGDVVILYGGKGAGKSTFIRRLLYHDPPPDLQLHAFPIIVDFLQAPQGAQEISNYVWSQTVTALDQDGLLSSPIENLVELFNDRFEIASRQELSSYPFGTFEYLRERNRLIAEWKNDKVYVTTRFQKYWKTRSKGLVMCFDNTDQLPPKLQDTCFLIAQNVARELSCTVIISMREERYCRARTAGVLDAYHNSGYHLAAPDLQYVFSKRLNFLLRDLRHPNRGVIAEIMPSNAPFEDISLFFRVCLRQFSMKDNAMNRFLRECSRDNTRLALDFFKQFLVSGYTHIEEMIATPGWIVNDHQVIKPMMIPERYNYDENKSLIPNIFQCRNASHGSHFTALRILNMLRHGVHTTPEKGGFWRVDALCDEYDSTFGMRADYEACLDVLLKHGLVEANNRLDSYSVEKLETVDSKEQIYADEIRITAFGGYMHDYLCRSFTYLDLVSLDCGLANERLHNEFCDSAMSERGFAVEGDRQSRLNYRINRAKDFVRYLVEEEEREQSDFMLMDEDQFMAELARFFSGDLRRVAASASRNIRNKTRHDRD